MKHRYYILFLLLFPALIGAQNERMSEKEVQEEAAFLSALQLRLLDKNEEAIEAFLALEQKDGLNDVVLFELAKLYALQKDQVNARKYAEKCVEINPDMQEFREFLIDICGSEKDYTALNEHLEYFIKSGAYDESYYFRLARSYRQMGSFKDAIDILDKLQDKTGYKKEIGKAKALVYQQQRNKRRLIKELDLLEKSFPDDTDVLLQKATMLQSQGEHEEAMETFQKLLLLDPDNRAANQNIIRWKKESSSKEDFIESLEPVFRNKAIPLDDKIKQLIPFVAELSSENEMSIKMLNLMNILQEIYPSDAKVNALHGDVLFNSDQLHQAIKYYERSIELNKSVFPVWKNLMLAQDHTNAIEELYSTSLKALDYYPNQAVCYYYVSKASIELNRIEEGLEWLQEGMMLTSNNNKLRAEFNLMMTYAYLQITQVENAKESFKKIDQSKLGAHHSFFFEVQGDLYAQDGNKNEALSNWKKSMELGGRQSRLQQKIDKVQ